MKVVLLLGLIGLVVHLPWTWAQINLDIRSVITVCNTSYIFWSVGNESLDQCYNNDGNGKEEDLFKDPVEWEYTSVGCIEDLDAPPALNNYSLAVANSSEPSWIQRNIVTVKLLVDFAQGQLMGFIDILRMAAREITKIDNLTNKFNPQFYLIIAAITAALFICQGIFVKRRGKRKYDLITNTLIGFSLSLGLYVAYIFYSNLTWTYVFLGFTLVAYSPFYARSPLGAIGILTTFNLIVPMIGFVIQRVFETSFLFGPVTSMIFNLFIITNQVMCLIGLFIEEKLTIVKVFLTPFDKMFRTVFSNNEEVKGQLSPMEEGAKKVTDQLLVHLEVNPNGIKYDTSAGLAGIINVALETVCTKSAVAFKADCPNIMEKACVTFLENLSGFAGFVSGVISFFGQQYTVCSWIAEQSCKLVEYVSCGPGSQGHDVAGSYFSVLSTIKQFTEGFMIKSLVPAINITLFQSVRELDLLNNSFYWYIIHSVSMFLAFFFLSIIVYSAVAGARFLRMYNMNIRYYNTYLSKAIIKQRNIKLTKRERKRYYDSPKRLLSNYFHSLLNSPRDLGSAISLILQSLLALVIERLGKVLHAEVNKIKFTVETYGDTNFGFDVKGTGIFATIFRTLLDGFSIRTRYCGISSTDTCEGPFYEQGRDMWILLFSLGFGFFIVGVIKQKSTYLMCRICDFINPHQADKRADHCLHILEMERHLMGFITDRFAEEVIASMKAEPVEPDAEYRKWSNDSDDSDGEDPTIYYNTLKNEKIIRFYRHMPHLYHKLPPFVVNMIAFFYHRIDNTYCQICCQNRITSRFRCNTLLFCEECANHLTRCPCNQSDCGAINPIPIK